MPEKIAIVVDDEALVAELLGEYMETLGFQSRVFTDPAEAFEFMVSTEEDVPLLVTDYNMLPINGAELSREAKRLIPEIKTVCITGYIKNEETVEISGFDGFLEKPFVLEQIKGLIEKVLP
ncbi:MAG: response regulator [Candidatus Moraniibacteriota bacterium]